MSLTAAEEALGGGVETPSVSSALETLDSRREAAPETSPKQPGPSLDASFSALDAPTSRRGEGSGGMAIDNTTGQDLPTKTPSPVMEPSAPAPAPAEAPTEKPKRRPVRRKKAPAPKEEAPSEAPAPAPKEEKISIGEKRRRAKGIYRNPSDAPRKAPAPKEEAPAPAPKTPTKATKVGRKPPKKAAEKKANIEVPSNVDPSTDEATKRSEKRKDKKASHDIAANTAWSVLKDPFANPFDNPNAFALNKQTNKVAVGAEKDEDTSRLVAPENDPDSEHYNPYPAESEQGIGTEEWRNIKASADVSLLPQGMLKKMQGQQKAEADYSLLPHGWREDA
jgi:hypothetical protein